MIEMPANCVLNIKSGALRNGSISGNKTKLNTCSDKGIAVILKGSWLAPVINDLFFDSSVLTDDQIIANINTLQSDDISNSIIIGTKDYHCTITKLNGAALVLRSNTKCILKSIITLLPCAFPNYQIVQIYDVHDVEFKGGKIVGDLLDHPYTSGSSHEWGHGISIKNAQRVKVTSVFVTHCIGDGIVVGGWQEPNTNVYDKAAKQVRLENIVSDDNRRQAMTISHADGVVVNNCRLTNTGKTKFTAPSAGLDIEPNSEAPWNQGVKNVLIENCFFAGNKYRQFLIALIAYFFVDAMWGLLYEQRWVVAAYIDTILVFSSMVLSVLFWTKAVVVFIGNKGKPTKLFVFGGWFIFGFEMVILTVNLFVPIVFTFTAEKEYVALPARYIALLMQMVMFLDFLF